MVQQKKGKVKTTSTINGTPVNEEGNLEKEADQMGSKAQNLGKNTSIILQKVSLNLRDRGIIQKNETDAETANAIETEATPNQALLDKLVKYRGLVDMAKNAHNVLADAGMWKAIVNKTDVMAVSETVGGITGDVLSTNNGMASGLTAKAISATNVLSVNDKVAEEVSAVAGSSIKTLFSLINSIKTIYQGFKTKDKMAAASGSKEFVNAVKSGLTAANSVIKSTSGVVNPGIAKGYF